MIDEYGEGLYPDLLFYYGVNLTTVIAGDGPSPYEVLLMVQRLPDTSMTIAIASGGRHHFGWGTDRHMMASLFDALNQNTRATGNWGKKGPPKIDAYPRPVVKAAEKSKPKTVADIFKVFTQRR